MKNTAQASTQAFTEIIDIRENVVLLKGNAACLILQITSVNFSLLSGPEQDAKVSAYAALLNSLSFSVQILIRSKPVDVLPYVKSIEEIAQKTQNPNLRSYISQYKDFVTSLVKISTVLDKQFYLVIPYTQLEAGVSGVLRSSTKNDATLETFFQEAQASLQAKADGVLSQIHRLSLQAKILEKDTLMRLFYDIYNEGGSFSLTTTDLDHPMVKGAV